MGSDAAGQLAGERRRVSGQPEGLGGVVADGDVIGVAVEPVGAEGQHDLGAEAAHLQYQPLHHRPGVGVDERLGVVVRLPAGHSGVPVGQHLVALQSQGPHRAGKLHPAYLAQGLPGGGALLPDLPLFPQRGGDETHFDAAPRVLRQHAANREGFVVGVSEAGQQPHRGRPVAAVVPWCFVTHIIYTLFYTLVYRRC